MKRLGNRGGTPMLLALILSGLIGIVAGGLQFMTSQQNKAITRRMATASGKDVNGYAVELANQLRRSGIIVGYLTPLYNTATYTATFWTALPVSGFNWSSVSGFAMKSGLNPSASLTFNICVARKLRIDQLLATYSKTPALPAGCATTPVTVAIADAQSGAFVEILSRASVPQ